MKTKEEIEHKLELVLKELRSVRRNFKKFDSYEDLRIIEQLQEQVDLLDWVLDNEN